MLTEYTMMGPESVSFARLNVGDMFLWSHLPDHLLMMCCPRGFGTRPTQTGLMDDGHGAHMNAVVVGWPRSPEDRNRAHPGYTSPGFLYYFHDEELVTPVRVTGARVQRLAQPLDSGRK